MIKINTPDLDKIAKYHYDNLIKEVRARVELFLCLFKVIKKTEKPNSISLNAYVGSYRKDTLVKIVVNTKVAAKIKNSDYQVLLNRQSIKPKFQKDGFIEILQFLLEDSFLDKILVEEPDGLIKLETLFKNELKFRNLTNLDVEEILKHIFSYDKFSNKKQKYSAYDLANKLNFNTCPYCNRQFTTTVVFANKKILRPQLDHFFQKSVSNILSISFYNLIPSCCNCNTALKGKEPFTLEANIHPYIAGFENDLRFEYDFVQLQNSFLDVNNYNLRLEPYLPLGTLKRTQIDGNVSKLFLKETYEYHKDVIAEIFTKISQHPKVFVDGIVELINDYKVGRAEAYRFYFSNFFHDDELPKRILSKFTKDIIRDTPELEKIFFD